MTTIANVMLVLNEAEFIEAAVRSVWHGVDQLIVIDQGSTDETRNILTELEDEFDSTAFSRIDTCGQNFLTRGEQFFRNLTLDLCFAEWMMISDGDEVFSDGWQDALRGALSDDIDCVKVKYWQLVGTSEYHAPNFSFGGSRPMFFRKTDTLRFGPPQFEKCHCSLEGLDIEKCVDLSEKIDCFHLAYAKSDLEAKMRRNIERGDISTNPEIKAEFLRAAQTEPLNLLPECVPISEGARARMPSSIRDPKFVCDYDLERQRLLKRNPK